MLAPTRVLRASWSSTLRLPKSTFPPRPSPASTPEYLRRCTDDLYAWQRSNDRFKAKKTSQSRAKISSEASTSNENLNAIPHTFTLHDGPPYANGPLHIGHALNKITKDMICRFQVGQGKKVSYIPGWDCHGLPIEIKALQAQKTDAVQSSPVSVREAARELATRTIQEQKRGFKEWAVMGDWDDAYMTMERGFEIRQLEVFKSMFEKGLIYRENKPVHWSPSSRTALAEAELEYDEAHESLAAFVKFPVHVSNKLKNGALKDIEGDINVIIWTTTPWTLPANTAIAVHKDMEYFLVKDTESGELTIVAATRFAEHDTGLEPDSTIVLSTLRGSDLAGELHYENPFQRARGLQPVIHADFVTDSSGTGLVHLAAGHGMDDYHVCHALGFSAFAPIDDAGAFTKDAFPEKPEVLEGLLVADEAKTGSNAVCDYLEKQGLLQKKHAYTHKYPIDWRTKQPVITRATEQWFANVESIKSASMKAIAAVNFMPDSGRSRLESFIEGRSQWCISRQRAWGVPIPALYRVFDDRLEATMDPETIDHIINVIKERGINAWWTDSQDDPAWTPKHLTGTYIRGRDTMDVWFDSGTSWTLLPSQRDVPVADVYLEGTDQHRGWFQSSLLTYVATQPYSESVPQAPYQTLITHGFTLDSEGRKMSKSLGNVISPSQIMSGELLPPVKRTKQKGKSANNARTKPGQQSYDSMGSDALRLWVASSDYMRDVTIGQPVLMSVNQALHKYRVTFKWLLGIFSLPSCPPTFSNLEDLATQSTDEESSANIADRLALHRLVQVSHEVHAHYAKYEFFKGINTLNKYISNDLSAFYFETLKDRIYTGTKQDCQTLQRTLALIFYELLKILAPILPLLVEETWDHLPSNIRTNTTHPARTHWTPLSIPDSPPTAALDSMLADITTLNTAIKAAQERLRANKIIGSPLESSVALRITDASADAFTALFARCMQPDFDPVSLNDQLASLFIVSEFSIQTRGGAGSVDGGVTTAEEKIAGIEGHGWLGGGASVVVRRARDEKCPRCWRFVKGVEEEVCGRCKGVLGEGGM